MAVTARDRLGRVAARLRPRLEVRQWVLSGEGCARVENPPDPRIDSELHNLHSRGPSFLIMATSDGSYIQAAGSAWRLTVELHLVEQGQMRHFVVRRGASEPGRALIQASFGRLALYDSEVIAASDAAELFHSFRRELAVPAQYHVRDITDEIHAADERSKGFVVSRKSRRPARARPERIKFQFPF